MDIVNKFAYSYWHEGFIVGILNFTELHMQFFDDVTVIEHCTQFGMWECE